MNQTGVFFFSRIPFGFVKKISRHIDQNITLSGTISVAFVSEKKIRNLNKQYRKKDQVTDVLAFELEENLGEVLICRSQAKRQAKAQKIHLQKELARLIVHGILHCFGYDHEDEKDAQVMFPLQEKILQNI